MCGGGPSRRLTVGAGGGNSHSRRLAEVDLEPASVNLDSSTLLALLQRLHQPCVAVEQNIIDGE